MQIRVTDTAEQDLLDTLHFYQAPSAMGDAFNALVSYATALLRSYPHSGHRRRDLTKKDVCFWNEGFYLFVFSIQDEVLSIVAVLHTSRNVARILKKRLK
jgi:plasmid stabilization system protein ParE